MFVNANGQAVSKHVSDKHWDINKFVMFLRTKQLGWQEIFWKMWARLQEFKCVTCDTKFIGSELNHCASHPQAPRFLFQENAARYPCCYQPAERF